MARLLENNARGFEKSQVSGCFTGPDAACRRPLGRVRAGSVGGGVPVEDPVHLAGPSAAPHPTPSGCVVRRSRPGPIRHNDPVTDGRHAGSRKGPRQSPSFRPKVFLLALATTAAIVAWGYLVYLAIDFGTSARGGESRAWWFLGLSSLGAVLCLFLGLVLVARLLRALGITAPPGDDATADAPAHPRWATGLEVGPDGGASVSEPWSPRRRQSASESLGESASESSGEWVGESVESLGFEPRPRPQVPRRTALIGAGVTLLVAVGGVFGWNLWQGRSADQDLLLALPQPVSETPTAGLVVAGRRPSRRPCYAVGDVTLVEHGLRHPDGARRRGRGAVDLRDRARTPSSPSAPGRDDVFVEASLRRHLAALARGRRGALGERGSPDADRRGVGAAPRRRPDP